MTRELKMVRNDIHNIRKSDICVVLATIHSALRMRKDSKRVSYG